MAIGKQQLEALQDAELRRRVPSLKTHFERADGLLKEIGPRCSRLVGIWQAVLIAVLGDERTSRWFTKTYPDLSPHGKGNVQGAKPQQKQPATPVRKRTTPVDRAIRVLGSHRRRKK